MVIGEAVGPYTVVAKLGEGGMGEVYRARDTRLDRDVALKILPESFAADPERLARFEREAKTLASLNHPHIAQIYGVEETPARSRALVMELVEGEDLSQRIALGAIPIDEALPIARQIAAALEAAHELGIIHRDLKPANVKLRPDGTVKVLDFGLAKALDRADASAVSPALANSPTITTPAMTQAGMILGTAAYMSPEQAKGRVVDRRTDLWAFGCVLFEMLTGKRTFAGDDVTDTLTAIFRDEPQWSALPADTPAPVHRLLRRCLQKDRARRLDSAATARIELDEPAGPDSSPIAKRRQTPPWLLGLLGAATIASLVVAGFLMTRPAPVSEVPVIRFTLSLPPSLPIRTIPTGVAVAISPDGKSIVYTSGTEGQLVRRRLDGEDFEVFKECGAAPFFSPDSRWIGFFSDGRLKKMPIDGGQATTICNTELGRGTWGDDGTIVFASLSGLFRVPSGGGAPHTILPASPVVLGPTLLPQPVFLPGSRTVLLPTREGTERIQAVSLVDGTRHDVTEGLNPVYADDHQVVFVKDNQLWVAPFDAKRPALRGPPVPVLEGFRMVGAYSFAGAASDGTIVYTPGAPLTRSTLVWLDRKGELTPALAEPDAYLEPRLSPDGNRVAVAISKSDGSDLWVYDLARGTKLRLTASGNNVRPRWTPDGLRLAFASEGDIYLRRADGSGAAEPVLVRPLFQFPDAWTPNGKTLIYNEGTLRDLWVVQGGQQPVRLLPESPFSERSGSVSPDGKWLVFTSNESGRDEIYVQPFPGPGPKVAVSSAGGLQPAWSRDGRELFYRQDDAMMAVQTGSDPTRAGAPRKVFDFPMTVYGRDPNRVEYDVARDGRFLAVRANGQLAGEEIRVVTNWLADRMRAVSK